MSDIFNALFPQNKVSELPPILPSGKPTFDLQPQQDQNLKDTTNPNAFTYMQVFLKHLTTSQQSIQNVPDYFITNPRARDTRLVSLMILFDVAFSRNGALQINVNGQNFATFQSGDLDDIKCIIFPIPSNGLNFKFQQTIDFYLWNPNEASNISLTVTTTLGDYN